MTHQTSWHESTGVCGVQQNQAGGGSVLKRACTRKVSQPRALTDETLHLTAAGLIAASSWVKLIGHKAQADEYAWGKNETVEYACWQWTNFLFRTNALDKAQHWYTPGTCCSAQSQGGLW